MDEVCSIPSCKGAPRDRSRDWPEARPKPVFSPPSWLVAGAFALRGRPHTDEPPWFRPPAAYGGIWCIGAEHRCTPRGNERSPQTTSTPRQHDVGLRTATYTNRRSCASRASPGSFRLRVLVKRGFFRSGDGYSGGRHVVLVGTAEAVSSTESESPADVSPRRVLRPVPQRPERENTTAFHPVSPFHPAIFCFVLFSMIIIRNVAEVVNKGFHPGATHSFAPYPGQDWCRVTGSPTRR